MPTVWPQHVITGMLSYANKIGLNLKNVIVSHKQQLGDLTIDFVCKCEATLDGFVGNWPHRLLATLSTFCWGHGLEKINSLITQTQRWDRCEINHGIWFLVIDWSKPVMPKTLLAKQFTSSELWHRRNLCLSYDPEIQWAYEPNKCSLILRANWKLVHSFVCYSGQRCGMYLGKKLIARLIFSHLTFVWAMGLFYLCV